jgi:hypothetical protein
MTAAALNQINAQFWQRVEYSDTAEPHVKSAPIIFRMLDVDLTTLKKRRITNVER